MMIKEYKIVRATDPELLEITVNRNIREGWQPFGSLVVTPLYYYQTVVK